MSGLRSHVWIERRPVVVSDVGVGPAHLLEFTQKRDPWGSISSLNAPFRGGFRLLGECRRDGRWVARAFICASPCATAD